jgi:hypothetical protein
LLKYNLFRDTCRFLRDSYDLDAVSLRYFDPEEIEKDWNLLADKDIFSKGLI